MHALWVAGLRRRPLLPRCDGGRDVAVALSKAAAAILCGSLSQRGASDVCLGEGRAVLLSRENVAENKRHRVRAPPCRLQLNNEMNEVQSKISCRSTRFFYKRDDANGCAMKPELIAH
mmetsp:Transcript_13831/g.40480  ORF Transcript_13831/g.40480 Transcript_13831/m.40480 type:complete len:118 (+) Transcript_13831:372-725(+)